jgi:hypothetical protein
MHPDSDGDTFFSRWRWALRSDEPNVRVQIVEGTTRNTAVRLLRKMIQNIEIANEYLVEPDPPAFPS